MGYTRSPTFRPGAFLKACSLCGIRYRNDELRLGEDGFWRCIQYCQEVPAITRDKISADSQRRKEAPPPPHGTLFEQAETFGEERQVLWFLTEVGRAGVLPGVTPQVAAGTDLLQVNGGTPSVAPANIGNLPSAPIQSWSEACRYFYNLITEGQRPASWYGPAKVKMQAALTMLTARQEGIGFNVGVVTQTNGFAHYGGLIDASNQFPTAASAAAGLAFLYGYRVFGMPSYLASAIAVGHFLRNMQAVGSCFASNFTSSDSAGTVRLYTGGIVDNLTNARQPSQQFSPGGLIALTFLKELFTQLGDGTYGCPNAVQDFSVAPAALLSQMIADLRAFWAVGAFDNVRAATITGLSSTTPAEYFNAYPATHAGWTGRQGTGTGSWEYQDANATTGTLVTATNFAEALRALYAYEGYSTQVASVWTWLMGFASNPAFVTASGTLPTDYACVTSTSAANPPAPPVGQGNIVAPFYDPTLALSTLLLVRDSAHGYVAIAQNGTSLYDWSTTGLLAAIQSAKNTSAFRRAKRKLITGYTRYPTTFSDPAQGVVTDYPMLRGTTGLAFQLGQNDSATGQFWSVWAASRCGNAFRYAPQAFTGTNPPSQQPGVSA